MMEEKHIRVLPSCTTSSQVSSKTVCSSAWLTVVPSLRLLIAHSSARPSPETKTRGGGKASGEASLSLGHAGGRAGGAHDLALPWAFPGFKELQCIIREPHHGSSQTDGHEAPPRRGVSVFFPQISGEPTVPGLEILMSPPSLSPLGL